LELETEVEMLTQKLSMILSNNNENNNKRLRVGSDLLFLDEDDISVNDFKLEKYDSMEDVPIFEEEDLNLLLTPWDEEDEKEMMDSNLIQQQQQEKQVDDPKNNDQVERILSFLKVAMIQIASANLNHQINVIQKFDTDVLPLLQNAILLNNNNTEKENKSNYIAGFA